MTQTFYDLLGVPEDASTAEIEAAYRERLKETHPDVSDAADAGSITKRLIEARDVLTDDDERDRYDRLGHEAYLGGDTDTAETGPANDSSVAEAAREAGYARQDGTAGSRATNRRGQDPHERARERVNRERRARERVSGERSSRTATDTTSSAASGGGTTRGRGSPTDGGWARGTTATSGDDSERAWNTSATYTVSESAERDSHRSLIPSGRSLTLLGISFALYPVLLFSTLLPAFPLFVNVLLGACTLMMIGYLQSTPDVAVLVFGGWSMLTPILLLGVGVGLASLVGIVALCGTWLPFGFSVLTRSVVGH